VVRPARAARQALTTEDAKHKLDGQGVDPLLSTPAEFTAYLKSETEKWTSVVRVAKIAPQ
jgi:tripartite-type tricarboxylate transporter receptor subunit TctC